MYQISGRRIEGEGHVGVSYNEGRATRLYGIMMGRTMRVYGIMSWRAMMVYGTIQGGQ